MTDALRAISLMVAGMFFFTLGDMFLKLATQHMPLGMVTLFLGFGMALLFWIMMRRRQIPLYHASYLHHALLMRCVGEVIGVSGMVVALAYAPLSSVTALIQSLPLVLTIMGAVFLGEKVGLRRASALIAGLIGVLIIIRPGMASFDVFTSFTLIGVLGMAIREFGTRILPQSISTVAVSFYGSVAILVTGFGMMVLSQDWQMPTMQGSIFATALIVTAAIGTLLVTSSVRLADMALVSPFRFSRVVFGGAAGVLFLGETIDGPTLLGSLIVVGAGLYSWIRERKLALQTR